MEPMKPSVMIKEVEDLPAMMGAHLKPFDRDARDVLTPLEFLSLHRVFVVGCGDSYHAALAAEMAFESIAGIPCEPMNAMRYLDYGAEWMPVFSTNDPLVVGVSASGGSVRVVQSLERAKEYRGLTLAMTGNPDGPLAEAADKVLPLEIPFLGRTPGIRTFSASLMGLYLLAIRIGELKDRYHQEEANAMRKELADLSAVVAETIKAGEKVIQQAADALSDAPMMIYLGSGPSYGTAMFSAAKAVEAAGLFAVAQDLEEYAHVENLSYPDDMPTYIVAPPGRGYWRAVEIATYAKSRGRRVVAVVQEDDKEIAPNADFVFPVVGEVREEFSPLVYHVASNLFASYLTTKLGRLLFRTDNPASREGAPSNIQVEE